MNTFDLHHAPGHLVRRLYQRHNAIFAEEIVEHASLTSPQFAVLAALAHAGARDQASLSRIVGLDRTTIGGVIDRLEYRGLVHRSPDASDGRRKVVRLTEEGKRLFKQLVPDVERVAERLLSPLSQRDRRTFEGLLVKILCELDEDFEYSLHPAAQ